jgi:hypothetical protein
MLARTPRGRLLQRPALTADIAGKVAGEPSWTRLDAGPRDRRLKRHAMRFYRSQFSGFGKQTSTMIVLYELAWGGEGVAWISTAAGP